MGVVATVDKRTAKALSLGRRATTVAQGDGTAGPGDTVRVKVKFSKKAARRLKRARRVKLQLTILALGENGDSDSTVRKLTLKR